MILECPNCKNRYLVDPRAIGESGRTVRCAKCKHKWFAEVTEESPLEADVISTQDLPEEGITPRPIPEGSSVPALPVEYISMPKWLPAAAVCSLVLFLVLACVYFRPLVEAYFPQARKAFHAVGIYDSQGIVFADMAYTHTKDVSKDHHKIVGFLVNTGGEALPLPRIHVALFDDKGNLLRKSRIMEEGEIAPGEKKQFSREIAISPESAKRIVIETGSPWELRLR